MANNPAFDPSSDFAQAADGLESVTLRRRGGDSGDAATIAHALRRAVTIREAAASSGRYTASDVTWHLPANELSGSPRLGDVIADAGGTRWTILEAQRTTLGTRWRCTARSLALVYALDSEVSILKAVYAKGTGGAAEATWVPWRTGVRARIQPAAARPDAKDQARRTRTACQVFLDEEEPLGHAHRIVGSDGTLYAPVESSGCQRLDQVQVVEVEILPAVDQ